MSVCRRLGAVGIAALFLAPVFPSPVHAQGITTGAVSGMVTDSAGNPLGAAQIRVVNKSTGFVAGGLSRDDGHYLVQGLETGGPYEVSARRIGFQPFTYANRYIGLSQNLRLDFKLGQQAAQITGVTVIASTAPDFAPSNTGTKAIVSDTAIQRLPTLTRNLTDFVRLTPQVSQAGPGFSGGGMSNRMNNVQIDGATERDVFGLGSTGTPGAEVNAKSVSIEAVKEFQVLMAPFDVRQGNFGGLLLNAVTKSGTNDFHGSTYWFYRNQNYGADTSVLRATAFDRTQWGFSLGGPIVKDKLQFYVAPEFSKTNSPVTGPYFNQPSDQLPKFPLTDTDRQRFESIMARYGEKALGTPGYVNTPNPLSNVFGRLDYAMNDVNRLVFRFNYSKGELLRQQNARTSTRAVYEDNYHDFTNTKAAPVLQLFSNFKSGASNEVFLGYNRMRNRRVPLTQFPQVTVNTVPGPNGNASIIAGADQFSQGNELDTDTYELTDNFTIPSGNHTITFGTRNEYVKVRNLFNQSSYGVWTFASLDSLDANVPKTFRRAFILANGGNVYFDGMQNAFYAQDQWQAAPHLSFTAGIRFDVSSFLKDIPYSAPIDSAYGRRTDDIPKRSVQFSPRLGFNWDVNGNQVNQIRGGIGLFVGTPPYVWLENAYVNSGSIITFLNCGPGTTTPPPKFQVDPTSLTTCANGSGSKPIGDVNFIAKDLKFPQPLRGTIAYDRKLPMNLVFTAEGMYSKTLNQLFFVSRNLAGPQGVDPHGRVLYDTLVTLSATSATPVLILPPSVVANGGTARFTTAIDLTNQSKDYAYTLTAQLQKRYSNNWEGMVAYTYGHSYDVQSFTSSTAISNWQFGRDLSGRQEDAFTGVSLFDQPHKLLASGSYTLRWLKNFSTDFSLFYQGVSGAAHDYVYTGDANGDASTSTDLLYVPKDVNNTAEIQFRAIAGNTPRTAAEQAAAFDKFINNSPCLSKLRGQIMTRNACRQPFFNQVDVAIRQNIPTVADQRISVQFDIFNFGNLLNKKWGQQRVTEASSNSNVPLLTLVGYSSTDPRTAVPITQFNVNQREYIVGNFVSNFWRTQVSMRYSF
jgi:hypothetical protein